jgi:4-amino-4-deoxy-L-arabinose transferase-like glycosyltransferase
VGQASALGVDDDERYEGDEIEEVAAPPREHESGREQQQRVAVRREGEAEERHGRDDCEHEQARREGDPARAEIGSRWAPALVALVAALLAVGARAAFWRAPLTADEGGYAEVARLWKNGVGLYSDAWVDRPQGLLLVFRGLLDVGGGSTVSLRVLAAVVAMLVVVATMAVALRVCGTIEAIAAGLLLATFGASPFIESFTLSGELLAAFPAVLSLLAFTAYLRDSRSGWLVLAGVLTGCAVLVKQSAFDAGLAAVAFLLLRERRRGVPRAALLVAAAFVPVAIAAASAPHLHDWWSAVVAYRADGDSLLTGSPVHRLGQLVHSLPPAAKALGLVGLLGAFGWRSSPLLVRLWLGAALVGAVGGGNFHPHYYIQLAPPLSILAAVGLGRLLAERRQVAMAACAAAAVATLAFTVPLWFASPSAQARSIWPQDPQLVHARAVAGYVRAHTRPGDRIYVLWAGADLYYLADRRPALPYMWYRSVEVHDSSLSSVRGLLARREPALVVLRHAPALLDPTGVTARLLWRNYRLATAIGGTPILEPRPG